VIIDYLTVIIDECLLMNVFLWLFFDDWCVKIYWLFYIDIWWLFI